MKTIDAPMTSQGQVTIPVEVRRRLGLTKQETVTFVIDNTGGRLVPSAFTLESVFGSIEPMAGTSEDFDREIEEAMEDHADQVVNRLHRSTST